MDSTYDSGIERGQIRAGTFKPSVPKQWTKPEGLTALLAGPDRETYAPYYVRTGL